MEFTLEFTLQSIEYTLERQARLCGCYQYSGVDILHILLISLEFDDEKKTADNVFSS